MKWILYQLWLLGWFKFETPLKEDRIKAYEKALEQIKTDAIYYQISMSYGLCFYIIKPQNYIELFYLKPYFNHDNQFWWNRKNYKIRIEVLKEAIKLAKKSTK